MQHEVVQKVYIFMGCRERIIIPVVLRASTNYGNSSLQASHLSPDEKYPSVKLILQANTSKYLRLNNYRLGY